MSGNPNTNGNGPGIHLSAAQFEGYRSRALSPADLQAVGRHLQDCSVCRRTLLLQVEPPPFADLLEEIPEELHLSWEQMSAWLDGTMTPAESQQVEAHTFLCASCSREIADLRKLDTRLAASPVTVPAVAEPEISLFEQIRQFFQAPNRMRDFGLAFGAIIAGFFVLFQADRTSKSAAQSNGETARWVHSASSAHPIFALGGFLLIAAGAGIILYGIFRKKK